MLWMILSLVFSFLYAGLQFQYLFFWKKIKPVIIPEEYIPSTGVTILISARNEGLHIQSCLKQLLAQSYPLDLVEIICIDDHSSDDTAELIRSVRDPRVRYVHLADHPDFIHPPAFKKSAISLGIDQAKNDFIVITDADCEFGSAWLKAIVFHYEKEQPVFSTGPVLIYPGKKFLHQMQEAELLMYTLITGAGIQSHLHALANGANMCFSKKAFLAVNGYLGNYQYASGDDLFLAEKMELAFPGKISFLKSTDAMVTTGPKLTWTSLLQQRIRWASKNEGLQNKTIQSIWRFVGIYHVLMVGLLITALFHFTNWIPFLILITIKWVTDLLMLSAAARFFNRIALLKNFILLQLMFTIYLFRLSFHLMKGTKGDWSNR